MLYKSYGAVLALSLLLVNSGSFAQTITPEGITEQEWSEIYQDITSKQKNNSKEVNVEYAKNTYIKPSNTGLGDMFGYTLAMSGDTLVVGAYSEDSSSTEINGESDNMADDAGAVYVYIREGTSWSLQAYLKPRNAQAGDEFGYSVAISGDTIVVGARNEDGDEDSDDYHTNDNTLNSGAAYVFSRIGAEWFQEGFLKPPIPEENAWFGFSVVIENDTIVVGAKNGDTIGSGTAYVFTRTGIVWNFQSTLIALNPSYNDSFGSTVAISGDTIAVGARTESSTTTGINSSDDDSSLGSSSGAVYIFVYTNESWSQQAYIKSSNSEQSDYFGFSVVLSGDMLVVGAPSEDSNATGINGDESDNSVSISGAVYVFLRTGEMWNQSAYLKQSNTFGIAKFGSSLTLSGNTLAVGAPVEGRNADGELYINGDDEPDSSFIGVASSGAVYTFNYIDSEWSQSTYTKASNLDPKDNFGVSVALSGETLVVGAFGEDSNATLINGDESDNSLVSTAYGTGTGAAYALNLLLFRDGFEGNQ